ncbi:5-bromo-4-chloroindolyl phosphate hydrolysis family protein [Lactococcus formosensis]|jgi:5-bromo-4-chloroindolyl phosphate hydrolysis protein|uniref:5-bromo-4-chloroindolyl phosphate hydrolysis family protein n=1 Tax=Lactococcus formosensis TaxID=1281486 RepID=UPI001BCB0677|nr:5-bromo-4-chloroindolyl phosphate hydrolysis family protein [Lactococcus formosensis]
MHMTGMMMGGMHGFIQIILILLVALWLISLMKNKSNKKNKTAKKPPRKENIQRYQEAGLSESDIEIFRDTLADAKENIEKWETNTKKNDELEVVESVTGGLEASKLLFKHIVQNPTQLTKQNDFLYKDLPNMVKLTEKYLEMQKQSVKSEEVSRDMDETLLLIKTLAMNISKNYHEILMDDVNVIKHEVKFD